MVINVISVRNDEQCPGFVRIDLDSRRGLRLLKSDATALGLSPGLRITQDLVSRIYRMSEVAEGCRRALKWINRRALSRSEVCARLGRRGMARDVINEIIARLEMGGFIDDRALATGLAEEMQAKGFVGDLKVRRILERRGLDEAAVHAAVAAPCDDRNKHDRLQAAIAQRLRRMAKLPPGTRARRLHDWLCRHGHEPESAEALARTFVPEADVALSDG